MPISGSEIVARLIQIMPGQEAVTLQSRLTRETGYTSYAYAHAQRKPAKRNELMMAGATVGEEWISFALYKTTEAVTPKNGDKITDADAVIWQVKKVEENLDRTVFKCLCLRNQ